MPAHDEQSVSRFIRVVAPERGLVSVEDILVGMSAGGLEIHKLHRDVTVAR
jgi:hypothetical protein